jgi:hypothetical protein
MSTTIKGENLNLDVCVDQGDIVIGPLRTPRNMARSRPQGQVADPNGPKGNIHDDDIAQKLGFRGGTVAGSVHMAQFPPVLVHVFGDRWWQTGSMSLYFRYATMDNEAVRCFAKNASDLKTAENAQTDIWIEDTENHLVAEGTGSIGKPDMQSALRVRMANTRPSQDLRILKSLTVGAESNPTPARSNSASNQERLKTITEPLPVYFESRPYISPSLSVQLMRNGEGDVLPRDGNTGIGLFGAIELQYINGPVYADTDYTNTIKVTAISETPKTEYFWYESTLRDEGNKTEIARMLMMLRFMKASSPLWQ